MERAAVLRPAGGTCDLMAKTLRCAIYTRKSSEEGLEQGFNSLHAQREACEAYVLSQAGEGWICIKSAYDDGGFSGGSIDRPGLKCLLADIDAGRIDVVVVYKVDRLTRSLTDFARIVDRFDARDVSFVSVTQAFNTTSSMGRLTLNVLLSFAQFEREVTGERIRDKIAASKAKGMWMGGNLSLGYDASDRTLTINEPEAMVVRRIFERYLELGSVNILARELERQGVRSKAWVSGTGKSMGGSVITRGALFHILRNRLYRGQIVHKDKVHPGLHPPIISADLFEAVAAKLERTQVQQRNRPTRAGESVLTGLIFDALGAQMSPSFAYGRHGGRYRYYISMALQVGMPKAPVDHIRRVSAPAVEAYLVEQLRRLMGRAELGPGDLKSCLRRVELRSTETHLVLNADAVLAGDHPELARQAFEQRLRRGEQLLTEPGSTGAVRLVLAQRLQLRGGRTWINGAEDPAPARSNPGLRDGLRAAHAELVSLKASPMTPKDQLIEAAAPANLHQRQLSRLAFLAPDLQQMILCCAQPARLNLRLILKSRLPLAWADQRAWFETFGRA
jgi:site-specific DNA recombinase